MVGNASVGQTDARSEILERLRTHFGCEPARLPVVEQSFAFYERPNLHLATEELLQVAGRHTALIGIVVPEEYHSVSLSKLSRDSSVRSFDEGPVEYFDVALADERHLACVKRGLYVFQDQGHPVVMLVSEQQYTHTPGIVVEVMGLDRERAERFTRQLTRSTRSGKAYRGQVLSLEQDCFGRLSVLTTNRPDIVEPALAARPGRVDQAIEIPLPDPDCRRRLFELYGRGLTLELTDWEGLIERTAGASGAFIRELLRRAALLAAEDDADAPLRVREHHVAEALTELVVAGGALTQSLLGAPGLSMQEES